MLEIRLRHENLALALPDSAAFKGVLGAAMGILLQPIAGQQHPGDLVLLLHPSRHLLPLHTTSVPRCGPPNAIALVVHLGEMVLRHFVSAVGRRPIPARSLFQIVIDASSAIIEVGQIELCIDEAELGSLFSQAAACLLS